MFSSCRRSCHGDVSFLLCAKLKKTDTPRAACYNYPYSFRTYYTERRENIVLCNSEAKVIYTYYYIKFMPAISLSLPLFDAVFLCHNFLKRIGFRSHHLFSCF